MATWNKEENIQEINNHIEPHNLHGSAIFSISMGEDDQEAFTITKSSPKTPRKLFHEKSSQNDAAAYEVKKKNVEDHR